MKSYQKEKIEKKTITVYACGVCGTEYEYASYAAECEQDHLEDSCNHEMSDYRFEEDCDQIYRNCNYCGKYFAEFSFADIVFLNQDQLSRIATIIKESEVQ